MGLDKVQEYRTCLEQRMYTILTSLDISFVEQHPTREGFVVDFAIFLNNRKTKIAIEVDGLIWHSSKKSKRHDRFKDYKLRKSGWIVIRFDENFTEEVVIENLLPLLTISYKN